jgi:hypothetical protein
MEFTKDPSYVTSIMYNMIDVVSANIELKKFKDTDYEYIIQEERIYVRPNSHLQIWMYLKGLKGLKTVHKSYGKIW